MMQPNAAPPQCLLAVAGLLVLAAASPRAPAQEETQRVTAAVRSAGALFGDAVALAGDTLVVGAPGAGAVHVFEHVRGTGFAERQQLVPPAAPAGSRFGFRVVLDGDQLAVTALGEEAVYVLSRQADGSFGGWQRLQAPAPQAGALFGIGLALAGDQIFAGAPREGTRAGAVHVFARQADGTFAHQAALRPPGVADGDEFGMAVAMDPAGGLLVSAAGDSTGASGAGAVYVLADQRLGFAVLDKLVAPDAAVDDRAGGVLACDGDLLAVGVRNDDDRGRESGSVALWDRSRTGAFAYAGKLLAPDGATADLFGHSLALRGDRVMVGAVGRDLSGLVLDVGRAYLFARDTAGGFAFAQGFDSPAQQRGGRFGAAVALDDRGLAIGGGGADGGAGEVFTSVASWRLDPALSTVEVDRGEIQVGEEAVVTVVPMDETGTPIGAGLAVAVATSLGQLAGGVVDQGDGRYQQRVLGDVPGTAVLSAVVEGEALAATASLTVRQAPPPMRIAGQRRDGSLVAFNSIQAAVDAAAAEDLAAVLVSPGCYEEVVHLDRARDLALVGLWSYGLVTVRGLRITRSQQIAVEGLHVEPGGRGHGGVRLGPGAGNRDIVLRGLLVDGTGGGHAGIRIASGSRDVALDACSVLAAAGDGIRAVGSVTGLSVHACSVLQARGDGVALSLGTRAAVVASSTLRDNGQSGAGYGIARQGGSGHSARPEDVTLLGNDVGGNRGRAQRGRSTADFGRYDLLIDPADAQAPFSP